MTPVSISQESIRQEIIKKELDELLAIAERSTASIDSLMDKRQETYLRIFGYLLIAPTLVLSMGKASVVGKEFGLGGAAPFVVPILSLFITYLIVAAALQYRKMKRTERELRLERNVHGRLVSLLDGQYRRMDSEHISSVARATIDIRMRRLDRGPV